MKTTITAFELANASIGTRIRKKAYLTYLNNKHFGNVLECGCGAGTYSILLRNISKKLISIDINTTLVSTARTNVVGPEFLVTDIKDLSYNEYFDLVIAADVIEHTDDAEAAFLAVSKVLKSDGICICSVPNERWNIICKLLGLTKFSFGHNYLFTKDNLFSLINKTGFKVVYYQNIQGFFSAFLEGLIVRTCSLVYGQNTVKDSNMAIITSHKTIMSFLYYWSSLILYPLFVICDKLLPLRFEHFVVLKKDKPDV